MMRLVTVLAAMLLLPAMAGGAQAPAPDYRLYTAGGSPVTAAALAELAGAYDVVIFGEYHDNAVLHQAELELLANMFAIRPKLAVSLEMIERDVQGQLDAYLAGRIGEQEFLAKTRPWKNYQAAYRPLVEFARLHSLPVLAANIPRPLAAHYAKQGSLSGIPPELAGYLPKVHFAPEGEYRRKFMEHMSGGEIAGKMPVSSDKLESYYRAQCLKDDTMAESISSYHELQPEYAIIHYQGDFHSRQRLGVVEKLRLLNPALKVMVIAPVYVSDFADWESTLNKHQADGDILIFVKEQ